MAEYWQLANIKLMRNIKTLGNRQILGIFWEKNCGIGQMLAIWIWVKEANIVNLEKKYSNFAELEIFCEMDSEMCWAGFGGKI